MLEAAGKVAFTCERRERQQLHEQLAELIKKRAVVVLGFLGWVPRAKAVTVPPFKPGPTGC